LRLEAGVADAAEREAGLEAGGGTPQEFGDLFLKDVKKWAKVAKDAGVKVD